jgi:hypothetical protein
LQRCIAGCECILVPPRPQRRAGAHLRKGGSWGDGRQKRFGEQFGRGGRTTHMLVVGRVLRSVEPRLTVQLQNCRSLSWSTLKTVSWLGRMWEKSLCCSCCSLGALPEAASSARAPSIKDFPSALFTFGSAPSCMQAN